MNRIIDTITSKGISVPYITACNLYHSLTGGLQKQMLKLKTKILIKTLIIAIVLTNKLIMLCL
jgi:hypothetical protein